MKKISKTLRPKLGFDCIGGDMTGIILENLSENGIIFPFGLK